MTACELAEAYRVTKSGSACVSTALSTLHKQIKCLGTVSLTLCIIVFSHIPVSLSSPLTTM